MTLLPAVRSQIVNAAERRSRRAPGPWPRRARLARSSACRWRVPLIAAGVGLVLLGGAFGAGVIRIGPAAKESPDFSSRGTALGSIAKGTVAVLALSTADPGGGLPWGMRVLSTTRGVGCIQVGRLLDGKLGAIGQDGAFGNDGRFHELPAKGAFDPFACSALDANGRIFNNITVGDQPASGAWLYAKGSCAAPGANRYENPQHASTCSLSDERNLYYGMLGPDAVGLTYVLNGNSHTIPTVGPQGAYLIVTHASLHQLFHFAGLGTADVVPVDGPITELHYRDGSTCHLTSRSWMGGSNACTPALAQPVGYVPVGPVPTQAQVATPLHVRVGRAGNGREQVRVSFRSPIAITSDRAAYSLAFRRPGTPARLSSYVPVQAMNVRAGQLVTIVIGGHLGPPVHGLIHGSVMLTYANGPALYEGPGTVKLTVGRFSARVP